MNKIPTVTFRNNSLDNIVKGLAQDNVKVVVFERLIPNIKIAVEKNKKECIFCYVEDYQVIIPKSSFPKTLGVLEEFYLSKEDFTKCAQLRDLRNLIKV